MPRKPHRIVDEQTRQAAWDELVRLLIRGATQKQAAQELGFHIRTIEAWVKKPEFKAKLLRTRQAIFNPPKDVSAVALSDEIREKIKEYAREAINREYVIMLTSNNESIQLKAAQDLADRSPETHKSKGVQVSGSIALFTPQDLVVMAQKAKEIQEDLVFGHPVLPAPIDDSLALPIEAEPFEDRG